MNASRTAIALYVALGLHLLLALVVALNPTSQHSRGVELGLSQSGQGLDEIDQALAVRAPMRRNAPAATADFMTVAEQDANTTPENKDAGLRVEQFAQQQRRRAKREGGGGDAGYFATLRAHLSGFRRELPGTTHFASAKVGFTVSAAGQVSELRLVQRSGLDWLDAEALDLIRRAVPLPQPPQGRATSLVVPVELGTRVEGG